MDRSFLTRPLRVRSQPASTIGTLIAVLVVAVAALVLAGGAPGPPTAGNRFGYPARADATLTTSLGVLTGPVPDDQVSTSTHLIVASAGDTTTGGYWLAASDGGIFAFGAPFEGSAGAVPLAQPVVGMTATASDQGYWMVAADGGIFSYGDATFHGSMGGQHLNQSIVGMAATPDGAGYWLVASDGGIFAFGDATFDGSMGGQHLNSPMVGMQSVAGSYRLVAADGGLFSYGTPFAGAAVGLLQRRAVSLDSSGTGYRIVSADGSVYAFGGAAYFGSVHVPPLVGEVVTIDPGHDGGNGADPGFIDTPIDGGGFTEPCDTAGTTTASGYTEHAFNFDVAQRLTAALEAGGATVVLTRATDTGVGPCVNVRAAIGNDAGSDAAISIHGDGGPVSGRGFAVDVPVPVVSSISDNRAVVEPSGQLGTDVRDQFLDATGLQVSDYAGTDAIDPRSDLGGLNLSTVPKVLIECGNMQNPTDAALMENPGWRQLAAHGLSQGITAFLVQREVP